jgi:hypothetical protein
MGAGEHHCAAAGGVGAMIAIDSAVVQVAIALSERGCRSSVTEIALYHLGRWAQTHGVDEVVSWVVADSGWTVCPSAYHYLEWRWMSAFLADRKEGK